MYCTVPAYLHHKTTWKTVGDLDDLGDVGLASQKVNPHLKVEVEKNLQGRPNTDCTDAHLCRHSPQCQLVDSVPGAGTTKLSICASLPIVPSVAVSGSPRIGINQLGMGIVLDFPSSAHTQSEGKDQPNYHVPCTTYWYHGTTVLVK